LRCGYLRFQFPPESTEKIWDWIYETLKKTNPALVYGKCSNGFGLRRTGSWTVRDTIIVGYWARPGMLADFVEAGSMPLVPPIAMGDLTVSIVFAAGVLVRVCTSSEDRRRGNGHVVPVCGGPLYQFRRNFNNLKEAIGIRSQEKTSSATANYV
jgi:hypothetical protein